MIIFCNTKYYFIDMTQNIKDDFKHDGMYIFTECITDILMKFTDLQYHLSDKHFIPVLFARTLTRIN